MIITFTKKKVMLFINVKTNGMSCNIQEVVLKNGPYTRMIPDLKGVDPNDAFCIVPYEKGFTLLFHLETLLGGPGKNQDRGSAKYILYTCICIYTM